MYFPSQFQLTSTARAQTRLTGLAFPGRLPALPHPFIQRGRHERRRGNPLTQSPFFPSCRPGTMASSPSPLLAGLPVLPPFIDRTIHVYAHGTAGRFEPSTTASSGYPTARKPRLLSCFQDINRTKARSASGSALKRSKIPITSNPARILRLPACGASSKTAICGAGHSGMRAPFQPPPDFPAAPPVCSKNSRKIVAQRASFKPPKP